MVHRIHSSIKDVHELLTLQVPPEDIEELSSLVTSLLTSLESHYTAVDQALGAFRQAEVRFQVSLFSVAFPAKALAISNKISC